MLDLIFTIGQAGCALLILYGAYLVLMPRLHAGGGAEPRLRIRPPCARPCCKSSTTSKPPRFLSSSSSRHLEILSSGCIHGNAGGKESRSSGRRAESLHCSRCAAPHPFAVVFAERRAPVALRCRTLTKEDVMQNPYLIRTANHRFARRRHRRRRLDGTAGDEMSSNLTRSPSPARTASPGALLSGGIHAPAEPGRARGSRVLLRGHLLAGRGIQHARACAAPIAVAVGLADRERAGVVGARGVALAGERGGAP